MTATPAPTASAEPSRRAALRRIGVLATVTVVVALLAIGALQWRDDEEKALRPFDPRVIYGGVLMTPAAHEFTIGNLRIERPGNDVTVVEVNALTSPNVEFLGAFTIWPRDFSANKMYAGAGFPPQRMKDRHALGELTPATETDFDSQDDTDNMPDPLAVAAGFRLISGEVGAVNGIRVVYKVGDETVTEIFREAAVVCLPDCDDRLEDPGWERAILRQFGLLPEES